MQAFAFHISFSTYTATRPDPRSVPLQNQLWNLLPTVPTLWASSNEMIYAHISQIQSNHVQSEVVHVCHFSRHPRRRRRGCLQTIISSGGNRACRVSPPDSPSHASTVILVLWRFTDPILDRFREGHPTNLPRACDRGVKVSYEV